MEARIILLPGDGIGPEVTSEAAACLALIAEAHGHRFTFRTCPIGGCALDACGVPLPEDTLAACLDSSAVLLGAIGTPRHDAQPAHLKPEKGLLALRKGLGAFANLRPARLHPALVQASPLREERVTGTDLLIVRELVGGLYFGEPRSLGDGVAVNTLSCTRREVERIARVAFRLAQGRRGRVTSVDKANVLEASQLWRAVVQEVAAEHPGVVLDHLYVDACAMALVTRPSTFDVILTENLFGDILSDEASVLAGSLGLLPSASLGGRVGLFEPVHGSAPDLAGQDRANPAGAILSAAMLLRHALGLEAEADLLEGAVGAVFEQGIGTADLACQPRQVGTRAFGDAVRGALRRSLGEGGRA